MVLVEFIALSAINVGLVIYGLRRWGLVSAEGLLFLYYGSFVVSDNVELLFHYLTSTSSLTYDYGEFAFRIYPTKIYILALVVVMLGLFVGNPECRPISKQLADEELDKLGELGRCMLVVGLALFAIAVGLGGGRSFYNTLSDYRTEVMPYGGFWYRGGDIAVIGMALVLAAAGRRGKLPNTPLLGMMGVAFFLTSNKGGFEKAILWAVAALYVYNWAALKPIIRPSRILVAVVVIYLGLGVKMMMLGGTLERSWQMNGLSAFVGSVENSADSAFSKRWSDEGNYRSFCQFINTLSSYGERFDDYRVGRYALTAWVPRILYPNKPTHPFEAIGPMTSTRYVDGDYKEKEAPGWAGAAMADGGCVTLVVYLLIAGISIGGFRQVATYPGRLGLHLTYFVFVLLGGMSAETGVVGIIETIFLAASVMLITYALVVGKCLFRFRGAMNRVRVAYGSKGGPISYM